MHFAGVACSLSEGGLSVEVLSLWPYSAAHDCVGMTNLAFVYNLVLTRRLSLVRSIRLLAWTEGDLLMPLPVCTFALT